MYRHKYTQEEETAFRERKEKKLKGSGNKRVMKESKDEGHAFSCMESTSKCEWGSEGVGVGDVEVKEELFVCKKRTG